MGIDINGFVEVEREAGWWQSVINVRPLITRNYPVFGLLFGIGEEPVPGWAPVAPERGLPADASDLTVHWRRWWRDAFGESFLGADEVRRVWGREEFWQGLDDEWVAFLTEFLQLGHRFEDARIVVWFDD